MTSVADLVTRMYHGIDAGAHTKKLHTAPGSIGANPIYNAIRASGLRRSLDAFDSMMLPPALLHHSLTPKSNWLYGRAKAPENYDDVEYAAGRFTSVPRHLRTIVGAALLDDQDGHGVPAVIYQHDTTLYVHVHEAPLSALEGDLFQRDESTYLEDEVAGRTLAEKLTDLRRQVGAYMHGAGFSAMPGFLLDGNYHLVRHGPLPALWLRAAKTDHEHELLERALLEACMGVAQIDPSCEQEAPSQPPPVWSPDEPLEDPSKCREIVTIFDRHKDDIGAVIDSAETAHPIRKKAILDAMEKMQPRANKMALRPVVAQVAWWIAWRSVGLVAAIKPPVSNRDAAEKELREFERAEASAMARAGTTTLTLSALLSRAKWKTRVAFVGPAATNNVDVLRLANAVCDAGSAALAVRDLAQWFGNNGQASSAGMNLDGYSQLCGLAQRISDPQAILAIDVDGRAQTVKSMRLINATVDATIPADEAARMIAFPWVVPIIHTRDALASAAVQCNGSYMLIERLGREDSTAARDLLRVTDAVRTAYGAAPPKPRPTVGPEDLERFKRDVLQRIAGMESALKNAPGVPPIPTLQTPTDASDYPGSQLVRDTLDVLDRALRKRGVEALAE